MATNISSQNLVVRIDPQLNSQSKKILDKFGLTQSGYIKLVLTKLVNTEQLNIDYSLKDTFITPTAEELKMIQDWENEKSKPDFKTISFENVKKLIDK
jgi:addiction module RelB/DinJ family antitoxin